MVAANKVKTWFKNSASGWKASGFIIGAVVCRSSANYAIVWGLMDYITSVWGKDIGFAAATINVKEGLESLTTIVGIFISDAYVGRYFVVLVSMALYIYGFLLFSLSVPGLLFYLALVLLAVGEGGMGSTLRDFGVDQFPVGMENKKLTARPSRVWWYMGSFIGSVLGMFFVPGSGDDKQTWITGGFISMAMMVAAFYWIAAGTLLYKIERPQGNPLKGKLAILVAVIRKRNLDSYADQNRVCGRRYPKEASKSGEGQGRRKRLTRSIACREFVFNVNSSMTTCSYPTDAHANLICSNEDAHTNGGPKDDSEIRSANGMSDNEVGVHMLNSDNKNSIAVNAKDDPDGLPRTDNQRFLELDNADIVETTSQCAESSEERKLRLFNQTEVAEAGTFSGLFSIWTKIGLFPVWTALGLFPIWTTFLMYGMVVSMGNTFFLEQAGSLDLRIPLTSLIAVSALSKIFISRACLPLLSRVTGQKHGFPPTIRIRAGMILVTLCCVTASLVEAKRLNAVEKHHLQDNTRDPVPMSVFWLVPQYVLSGAMNALVSDGISDFFVDQVPSPMRRCKAIFSESIVCMGRFLNGLAIVATMKLSKVVGGSIWFADDINHCRLDYYYQTFALLSLVNLCFYLYFEKRHPWNMSTDEERETIEDMLLDEEGMKAQAQDQKISRDEKEEDAPKMP